MEYSVERTATPDSRWKGTRRATYGYSQGNREGRVADRTTAFLWWQRCNWFQSENWMALGGMLPSGVSPLFFLILLLFLGNGERLNVSGNSGEIWSLHSTRADSMVLQRET